MKKIRLFFSLGALVAAVVLAVAFRPAPAKTSSPNATYWLKFDCSNPGQVQHTPGNRTAAKPGECTAISGVACAKQYNESSLELDPNYPPAQNIYRVKSGSQTVLDVVYCPQ